MRLWMDFLFSVCVLHVQRWWETKITANKKKRADFFLRKPAHFSQLAEGVGFEPTEVLPSTVVKTIAFSHSAIPPCHHVIILFYLFC